MKKSLLIGIALVVVSLLVASCGGADSGAVTADAPARSARGATPQAFADAVAATPFWSTIRVDPMGVPGAAESIDGYVVGSVVDVIAGDSTETTLGAAFGVPENGSTPNASAPMVLSKATLVIEVATGIGQLAPTRGSKVAVPIAVALQPVEATEPSLEQLVSTLEAAAPIGRQVAVFNASSRLEPADATRPSASALQILAPPSLAYVLFEDPSTGGFIGIQGGFSVDALRSDLSHAGVSVAPQAGVDDQSFTGLTTFAERILDE